MSEASDGRPAPSVLELNRGDYIEGLGIVAVGKATILVQDINYTREELREAARKYASQNRKVRYRKKTREGG